MRPVLALYKGITVESIEAGVTQTDEGPIKTQKVVFVVDASPLRIYNWRLEAIYDVQRDYYMSFRALDDRTADEMLTMLKECNARKCVTPLSQSVISEETCGCMQKTFDRFV